MQEVFSNALLVFINAENHFNDDSRAARGLIQFCKSARAHYRANGLNMIVIDGTQGADENFVYDAALGELEFVSNDAKKSLNEYGIKTLPSVALVDENGGVVWKREGAPRAFEIAFAVESLLGEPAYRVERARFTLAPYFDHRVKKAKQVFKNIKPVPKCNEYFVSSQSEFDAVKNKKFSPGDVIYFERGGVFTGTFAPSGSGAPGNPIRVRGFGSGPRPLIHALGAPGSVVLFNVEGWEIDGIDVAGGEHWGFFVGSDYEESRTLSGFTIKNCSAYNVGLGAPSGKDEGYTGPICVSVCDIRTKKYANIQWRNVLIENCEAYGTLREGIIVCGAFGVATRSENITVQNCFVHDTGFDGILVLCGSDVKIKDNVAYQTGKSPVGVGYSPNSIWTWRCSGAVVSGNEASFAHSPEHNTDGGAFDVDFYNSDNVYEYNYAHDNDTYGISVLGAAYEGGTAVEGEEATRNTIVRHNYFGNNQAVGWGEVYFLTWNGGTVDGFEFYNNFIFSNPADGTQPMITFPEFAYSGALPRVFRDNVFYSSCGNFLNLISSDGVEFDGNEYYCGDERVVFKWGEGEFVSFAEFRTAAGQERSGKFIRGIPDAAEWLRKHD